MFITCLYSFVPLRFLPFVYFCSGVQEKLARVINVRLKNSDPHKVFCCNCDEIVGDYDRTTDMVMLTNVRLMKQVPQDYQVYCRGESSIRGHGHIYRSRVKIVSHGSKLRSAKVVSYFDVKHQPRLKPCMGISGGSLFDRSVKTNVISGIKITLENTSNHQVDFVLKVNFCLVMAYTATNKVALFICVFRNCHHLFFFFFVISMKSMKARGIAHRCKFIIIRCRLN